MEKPDGMQEQAASTQLVLAHVLLQCALAAFAFHVVAAESLQTGRPTVNCAARCGRRACSALAHAAHRFHTTLLQAQQVVHTTWYGIATW
jgi:hypothetical protein